MKVLWHTLLILSAILVLINFQSVIDGSIVLDINNVIKSFDDLHFYTDYLEKFKDLSAAIDDLRHYDGFWESIIDGYKAYFQLGLTVFVLLGNSIANIANVLIWLLSLGFSGI